MTKTIKVDTVYRNIMVVVFVAIFTSIAVLDYYDLLRIGRYIGGLEGEELTARLRLVFICISLPVSIMGMHSLWLGCRVIKSNEFPPFGAKVFVETKVATGKLVTIRGWVLFISGLVMILSPIISLMWLPLCLGGY
jgi:hypothetical protein